MHECLPSLFSCVQLFATLWTARLLCPWNSPGNPILEWVAMPFSRGSSQPRDWTHIPWGSCIAGWPLSHQVHVYNTSILTVYSEVEEIVVQWIGPRLPRCHKVFPSPDWLTRWHWPWGHFYLAATSHTDFWLVLWGFCTLWWLVLDLHNTCLERTPL